MASLTSQTVRDLQRAFFFIEQRGVCYLRITPACRAARGAMVLDRKGTQRYATWDHLRPQSDGGGDEGNRLMACSGCNGLKASHQIATPADFKLARALSDAWRAAAPTAALNLGKIEPMTRVEIDASILFDEANEAARRALMRACGFEVEEAAPWIMRDGVKTPMPAAPKPKPKKRAPVVDLRANEAALRRLAAATGRQWNSLANQKAFQRGDIPAAGYDRALSERLRDPNNVAADELKAKRAADLGVTDPRYRPEKRLANGEPAGDAPDRSTRNATSLAAAYKGIAARAKGIDKHLAHNMTSKAKAVLDRFRGNRSNAPKGRGT